MTVKTMSGPDRAEFAGSGVAAAARRLFHATRPKFFPASVLPVVAGTAWGLSAAGTFDLVAALLALLATVLVHAGANVINDVGDEHGGTDRANTDRIYPYTGGSQFIQREIIDVNGMARLGAALLFAGALIGVLLVVLKGPMILAFGAVGLALAVLYSLGPLRLSSLGLGELAVAIGFGVLPVTGAAWLQTGSIDLAVVLFSVPIGMWVTAILLINEVPDLSADAATDKRTLPVRVGLNGTAVIYLGLHTTALAASVWLSATGGLPLAAPVVPLLLSVPVLKAASAIRTGVEDRQRMTGAIESTLAVHTIGSIWLAGCVLYGIWF